MNTIATAFASVAAAMTLPVAYVYATAPPPQGKERYGTRWHMWKHKYGNWSGHISEYDAVSTDGRRVLACGLRCTDCGFVNTHRVYPFPGPDCLESRRTQPRAWIEMNLNQQKQLAEYAQ